GGGGGGEGPSEDRTLSLFSDYLALFEMTSDGLDYDLHEMIPLSKLRMRRVAGKSVLVANRVPEEIFFSFTSAYDMDRWIDAFRKCSVPLEGDIESKSTSIPPPLSPVTVTMRQRKESIGESLDQMDAALAQNSSEFARLRTKNASQQQQMGSTPTSSTSSTSLRKLPKTPLDDLALPFRVNHELEMIMPEGFDDEDEREEGGDTRTRRNEAAFFIRNYPPFRSPNNMVDLGKRGVKMRKDQSGGRGDPGDAALLAIVEGYLGVGGEERDRGAASKRDAAPQLIVAEQEKLLVEEIIDGQTVMTEKSLVDVVYALKDQMDEMTKEMGSLRSMVEKEQRARRRLEDSIKRSSLQLNTSTPKPLLDMSN
ncbi:hypothetical protein PFISCL1PPCAC_26257, partial [Pristionchus fissidentatus]